MNWEDVLKDANSQHEKLADKVKKLANTQHEKLADKVKKLANSQHEKLADGVRKLVESSQPSYTEIMIPRRSSPGSSKAVIRSSGDIAPSPIAISKLQQQERLLVYSKQMELVYRQGDKPLRMLVRFGPELSLKSRNILQEEWKAFSSALITQEPRLTMTTYVPQSQSRELFESWIVKAKKLGDQICNWQGGGSLFQCLGMLRQSDRWIAAIIAYQRPRKRVFDHPVKEILTKAIEGTKLAESGINYEIEDAVLESIDLAHRLAEIMLEDQQPESSRESKPKGRSGNKKDLTKRSNREFLIAILLKHHRFNHPKKDLNLAPISTEEAVTQLGKSEATLSRTWKTIRKGLDYNKYCRLCGQYSTLQDFLRMIDSKEGYLERTNNQEAIDYSEE